MAFCIVRAQSTSIRIDAPTSFLMAIANKVPANWDTIESTVGSNRVVGLSAGLDTEPELFVNLLQWIQKLGAEPLICSASNAEKNFFYMYTIKFQSYLKRALATQTGENVRDRVTSTGSSIVTDSVRSKSTSSSVGVDSDDDDKVGYIKVNAEEVISNTPEMTKRENSISDINEVAEINISESPRHDKSCVTVTSSDVASVCRTHMKATAMNASI